MVRIELMLKTLLDQSGANPTIGTPTVPRTRKPKSATTSQTKNAASKTATNKATD